MEANEQALLPHAELLEQQLRFIRRHLRHSLIADERAAGLTVPQTQVMTILSKHHQGGGDGMSIRGLCEEVGLSQSTVSGIVERLARKGLVSRAANAADKRQTVVRITDAVKGYLDTELRTRQVYPLLGVLGQATSSERALILEGVATLQRLLEQEARRRSEQEVGRRSDRAP